LGDLGTSSRVQVVPSLLVELMTVLLEILLQILLEVIAGALFEGTVASLKKRSGRVSRFVDRVHMRVFPLSIILATGVLAGFIWGSVAPTRVLPSVPFPGILLVAPVILGLLFGWFGRALSTKGRSPSILLTFWGGATLAMGVALARFSVIWTAF
jgi:hypothetical protein